MRHNAVRKKVILPLANDKLTLNYRNDHQQEIWDLVVTRWQQQTFVRPKTIAILPFIALGTKDFVAAVNTRKDMNTVRRKVTSPLRGESLCVALHQVSVEPGHM